MSLPRYPAYKDCGVNWLGDVPEQWSTVRVRFLLKDGYEGLKIGPFGSQLTSDMLNEDGVFKVYGQENVIHSNFIRGTRFIDDNKFNELSVYKIETGDILITMMGTSGRCDVVPKNSQDGIMDSHLLRMRVNNLILPTFLQLLIDKANYVGQQIRLAGKGSIMHGLNSSIVKNLLILLPPIQEQTLIAQFLDRETAKIDDLITEQEKLIKLLDEKRQAMISHAVTKGLNPDAPMKNSGVEWLGEVPESWEVGLFNRYVYVIEGLVNPELEPYISMILIAPNHIESGTGRLIYTETASEQSAESGKYLCQEGDVIYSKIRPALRKACLAKQDSLCSADMYPLRTNSKLVNQFLLYFILSEPFSALAVLESDRVAMPKINRESLKAVFLAAPPLHEQISIIAYLDKETSKLDNLKAEAKRGIDLLKERRSALISAAVTGKIDVRNINI